jgi:hypothetical protein
VQVQQHVTQFYQSQSFKVKKTSELDIGYFINRMREQEP